MGENKTGVTPSEASMDGIQLVASILMCFPEMAKVTLDSEDSGVWLDFTLKDVPTEERMKKADKVITDSMRFYHELEGFSRARLAFFYAKGVLRIFRDIDSLTRAELDILVSIIRDHFSDLLLADTVNNIDEDVLFNQSEMIDHRIRFLRTNHIHENMVGIREEGRVMVY